MTERRLHSRLFSLEIIMPIYRLYVISDGHIVSGDNFECATDEYALSEAQGMLGKYLRAEVWTGTRMIGAMGSGAPFDWLHNWESRQSSLTS